MAVPRESIAERMKQAVYHSESETRRREYEQKRREREEREQTEQERRILLENELWDASEAVWNAEQVLRREGPKAPGEGFSWRYALAANSIHRLREYRDRLEYEIYMLGCKR